MLNTFTLVGRIKEINKHNDNEVSIVINVSRPYKNEDGFYENDEIMCKIYGGIAINVLEYCEIGCVIGIKGRMETKDKVLELVAEKVSFLSSKKEGEE